MMKNIISFIFVAVVMIIFVPGNAVANTAEIITAVDDYNTLTGGNLLYASETGANEVTITGSKTGATTGLALYIPSGTTVVWDAELKVSGSIISAVYLIGSGEFKMTGGEIDAAVTSVAVVASGTVNLTGGTINSIQLSNASSIVHMDGGNVTRLISGASGGSVVFGANTVFDAVISGTVSVTVNGTVTLTGNNTNTGGIAVNGGVLSVSQQGNLGGAANVTTLNNGTLILTSGTTINRQITLGTGGGTIQNSADVILSGVISGSGTLTKTGAGTLEISGNISSFSGNIINNGELIFNQPANTTVSGSISGSGTLVKNGAGTLTLSGANTYTGDTNINAGTLRIDTAYSVPFGKTLSVGSSGVFVNNNLLTVNGTLANNGAVTNSGLILMEGTTNLNMLTFDANGGTGNPVTVAEPGNLFDMDIFSTYPVISFARDNHIFDGWVEADGTFVSSPINFVNNATIYASWVSLIITINNSDIITPFFDISGELFAGETAENMPVISSGTGYISSGGWVSGVTDGVFGVGNAVCIITLTAQDGYTFAGTDIPEGLFDNFPLASSVTVTMDGSEIKIEITYAVNTVTLGGTASISGTNVIGQTLVADTSLITGGYGSFNYLWKIDDLNTGENNASYTIKNTDAGSIITCVISRAETAGSVSATFDSGNTVPFDIVVVSNDILTLSASVGRAGDEIVLSYNAGTVTFTGVTVLLSEPGTATYIVNADDAVNGVITINAVFLNVLTGWSTDGINIDIGDIWKPGALFYFDNGEKLSSMWADIDGIRYFGANGEMYQNKTIAMRVENWISEADMEWVNDFLLIEFGEDGIRLGTFATETTGLFEFEGEMFFFVNGLAYKGWIILPDKSGIAYNLYNHAAVGDVLLENVWKDINTTDPTKDWFVPGSQWVGFLQDKLWLRFDTNGLRIDVYSVNKTDWYKFKTHVIVS